MTQLSDVDRFFTRAYARAVADPWHCAGSRAGFMNYHKRYARFRGADLPKKVLEQQLSDIFYQAVSTGRLARLYKESAIEGQSEEKLILLSRALRPSEERLFEKVKAHIDNMPGPRIVRARVLHDLTDGLNGNGLWIRGPMETHHIRENLIIEDRQYKKLRPWAARGPHI